MRVILELDAESKRRLKKHLLHRGLNKRIADRLHMDASYVSKVAGGSRNHPEILEEILRELAQIEKTK